MKFLRGGSRREAAGLGGVSATMFLIFVGFSCAQFHGYLFEQRGFASLQIGYLLTAGFGAGILSPLLQVPIIRWFRGPRLPLMLALAGAASTLALLPFMRGFAPLLIVFMFFSLCNSAIFPLNSACTFEVVRGRGHGLFFHVRTLGTAGFLAGCLISACFPQVRHLPWLYGGFAAALGLAFVVVVWDYRPSWSGARTGVAPQRRANAPPPSRVKLPRRRANTPAAEAPGFAQALRLLAEPFTWRLMLSLAIMNFANAMATSVQGNYLVDDFHGSQRSISLAWVISTACEIPLMLLCARVLKSHGLRYVLGLGLGGTLIKLLGLACATHLWQYYLALSMHGFFFSGAVTGFGVHIDRRFRAEDSPALQALAVVFYQGLPAALAALSAGWIWHCFSLRAVYLLCGGVASGISIYIFFLLRDPRVEPG